jgi:hypothetical protein
MIKEQGSFVRECGENYGGYSDRGSYNRTDRTLGVLGTVFGSAALLALWNRNGNGGIGNLLGGGGSSSGVPTNVNINGGLGGANRCVPSTFEVYEHECADVLALTNTLWGQKVNTLELLAAQRNTDIAEKFGLYQSQITADFGLYKDNRDNIDRVNNRLNDELFSQYKYTRDKDDEIKSELSALKAEVAKNSAIRPYQDELIMCKIKEAFGNAINYTDRKTCKMITGVTVVPSTPTITGYGSYCCGAQSTDAAAGA